LAASEAHGAISLHRQGISYAPTATQFCSAAKCRDGVPRVRREPPRRRHDKIAGDVHGENVTEGKKTDEVNHSSDDAQAAAAVVPFLTIRPRPDGLPD
jgi:hypothetical protein